MHTNLELATYSADLESVKDGTFLHKDYVRLGSRDSKNVIVRIYNKGKEVIENGYKDFFFKLWNDNGLISYYDKWCYEYTMLHKNINYLVKARLAFYVEHGTDPDRCQRYLEALENKNTKLKDFKNLAEEWMPEVTSIMNIEYQTQRKFYYYSDTYINNFAIIARKVPKHLERIYKIIDNRELFLNYLNTSTLAFHKGKDAEGKIQYLDWWKRLRRAKVGGLKANEKLLRDYSHEMDKKCVQRRAINALASSAVYDDKVETGFIEDVSDFLSDLSDNKAHKMATLLFVDEYGEVADELYGKLLGDYRTIKAKKDVQLRNRKKRKKESDEQQS